MEKKEKYILNRWKGFLTPPRHLGCFQPSFVSRSGWKTSDGVSDEKVYFPVSARNSYYCLFLPKLSSLVGMSSILSHGMCLKNSLTFDKKKQWPQSELNFQRSDLNSHALPLHHKAIVRMIINIVFVVITILLWYVAVRQNDNEVIRSILSDGMYLKKCTRNLF